MKQKPTIGIVQGDPAGIGPELLVKLLLDEEIHEHANTVVIGAPQVFTAGEEIVGAEVHRRHINQSTDCRFIENEVLHFDLEIPEIENVQVAETSAAGGRSSLEGLRKAFALSRDGIINGICFMPFNKESMHLGGNKFADELGFACEFFDIKTRASEFNVAHGMWNGRVTSHVAMKDVPGLLSIERICESIELTNKTLTLAGYDRPRIVVAAYNPHAGDSGLMGREEIDIIRPAVEKMQRRQISVVGPLPADTLWLKVRDGDYDAVVTMYHDQGQIAIKLLGFDQGVSVLAGLPVPITTPAHGTAFDIAGRNKANPVPAKKAFMMVTDMAELH